ncbi:Gemin6 domain containing protein [Asbolus verrucosus]|uniref:Gemin6 domain containing protein n=1 Tax=Asbolus verrucosus TaxID=1661398 RepID=A0A482V7V6_ASBVE|nr:Gemin6 domain containing protein [Asbolus verrucosus]
MEEDTIFNDNVLYMKSLIGKTVSVETVDNQCHNGTVYVIDPVYKTVVLVNKESEPNLEFVLYRAIKSFKVLSDATDEDFLHNSDGVCTEEALQIKLKLVKWLKHMFIDVKEDGDLLRVEDHLTIGAPYGKEDCMCDNTIVLERIRNIIDLMPQDFE